MCQTNLFYTTKITYFHTISSLAKLKGVEFEIKQKVSIKVNLIFRYFFIFHIFKKSIKWINWIPSGNAISIYRLNFSSRDSDSISRSNIRSRDSNLIWRSNVRLQDTNSTCRLNIWSRDRTQFVWHFLFNFKDQIHVPFGHWYFIAFKTYS